MRLIMWMHGFECWLVWFTFCGVDAMRGVPTVCYVQNGRGNDDAKVIEPLFTYRGHRGPILTTAFSGTDQPGMSGLVATAGSDSVVCVWRLPPPKQELYGSFGKVSHLRLAALTGHTDAVWGLAWIPSTGRLVSAAADGCINAWTVRPSPECARLPLIEILMIFRQS